MTAFFLICSLGLLSELESALNNGHKLSPPNVRRLIYETILLIIVSSIVVIATLILLRWNSAFDLNEALALIFIFAYAVTKGLRMPNSFFIVLTAICIWGLQSGGRDILLTQISLLAIYLGIFLFRLSIQSIQWRSVFSSVPKSLKRLPLIFIIAGLCALALTLLPSLNKIYALL